MIYTLSIHDWNLAFLLFVSGVILSIYLLQKIFFWLYDKAVGMK